MKFNKVLFLVISSIILINFTGCFNSPKAGVKKFIKKNNLTNIPKDKNLEILGYVNQSCSIKDIEDIILQEYKLFGIKKISKHNFIGKGRVYKTITHNPTKNEIARCYGALQLQQNFGRYRTKNQANWYLNECIKGAIRVKTIDTRIKIKHKFTKSDELNSLKLNISNVKLSNSNKELGIYKSNGKRYLYLILPSFQKTKMKNFDLNIKEKLKKSKCVNKIININD